MQITGRDLQPEQNASQVNSIFFLIYNLLGAITVLTLFVSIILENAARRSGAAFLTADQRQWLDLKKLLIRQRPSTRPVDRSSAGWRGWCYKIAIAKHGAWNTALTALYLAHIGILLSYTDAQPVWADSLRGTSLITCLLNDLKRRIDGLFLLLSLIYAIDLNIRLVGLGWKSFSQNGWNLFETAVVAGILTCTIPLLLGSENSVLIQVIYHAAERSWKC